VLEIKKGRIKCLTGKKTKRRNSEKDGAVGVVEDGRVIKRDPKGANPVCLANGREQKR